VITILPSCVGGKPAWYARKPLLGIRIQPVMSPVVGIITLLVIFRPAPLFGPGFFEFIDPALSRLLAITVPKGLSLSILLSDVV
jgi:hypothetical protein